MSDLSSRELPSRIWWVDASRFLLGQLVLILISPSQIAEELAEAKIGVIVSPIRSFPHTWDQRRIMAGLPWTEHTLPAYLASKGVTVALGIQEEWLARQTKFEAAWQYTQGPSTFSKAQALDLVSTNLEKLLGVKPASKASSSWVAWEGDWTSNQAKAVAVRGQGANYVDMFA